MHKAIDWVNDVYIIFLIDSKPLFSWDFLVNKRDASNKNSFAAELAKDHLNPAFNKSYKVFHYKLISLTVRVKQRRAMIYD